MLERIVKTTATRPTLFLTVLLIGGCANYRGIHSDKTPRAIDSFAASASLPPSAGEWPQPQWWTQFSDAQLNTLIAEALSSNASLQGAAARLQAAQAYTGTARAALYPTIGASADIQYQHLSENWEIPPPFGGSTLFNNMLQLNGSYELDFWGKNRSAIKAALSSERAAEAENASAKLLITTALSKTYIELSRLYELRDVAERSLTQREKLLALTQQRVDSGLDSRSELKQAETQLPVIRGQLAQIDEAIGTTRNSLAALIGAGPDRGLQITRPQLTAARNKNAQLPANLPIELLGRRPDIVASRWRVEAALRASDVAKAEFYPNVNLNASFGYASLGMDNLTRESSQQYGVGPALNLPIFAGGRLRANLKQRYAQYDEAVANYDETLAAALHDVADQINTYKWLQVRQHEQQSALAVAHDALNLTSQRYKAGLGNYLNVLNAETQVLTQEQLGAELNASALSVRVSLIKALGGGFDVWTPTQSTSFSAQAR